MTFETLGLAPALLRALDAAGYNQPTPIQAAAIPLVLASKDVLGAAQTGTGKTAAFTLPILDRLFARGDSQPRRGRRRPRALIVTPTRELAAQVHESLRAYAKFLPLKSAAIFGGVSINPQLDALARGVDVLVATPGRLLDHLDRGSLDLGGVEVLVLDEADRMLDMGFLPAIRRILAKLPRERQTLLFSATFPAEIKALAVRFMREPQTVEAAPANTVVASVDHRVHPVDASAKRDLLLHILAADSRRQTLVFSRTKHGANKLVKFLEQAGLKSAAIHGNKSQNQRTRALADFKSGAVTVLVATDIAARGIDIQQLPMVVNFDLPMVAEDYVHRIGRTGRAGASGLAVSLVAQDEVGLLRDIRKLVKHEIPIVPVAGFEPRDPWRLDARVKKPAQRGNAKPASSPRPHRQRGHAVDAPPAAAKRRRRRNRGRAAAPRQS